MKKSISLSLVTIALLTTTYTCAAAPRSVDPRTLDIAGVKTGMSIDQAKSALATHFGVPASQLKTDPYPNKHPVTGTKVPSYITYEKSNEKVLVHFEPRFSDDSSNIAAVSQILYELPWTKENEQAIAKAAITKYGSPSNGENGVTLQWCEKPSTNPGMGCNIGNQATLSVSGTKVQIVDPFWAEARIEQMNKSKSTTPGF